MSEGLKSYAWPAVAALGLGVVFYTAHGAFSRFDDAKALYEQAVVAVPKMVEDGKELVATLEVARAGVREDLTALQAGLPAFGAAAGAAGGIAINTADELIKCPEDATDCNADTGLRGLARRGMQKLGAP